MMRSALVGLGRRALAAWARLREHAGAQPQHAVVAATVAGLLLGPRAGVAAIVAAALAAALAAPGPVPAAMLSAAVLGGAWVSQARTERLERSRLARTPGRAVEGVATLSAPPRPSPFGWSAVARFDGEPVLLRGEGAVPRKAAPTRTMPAAVASTLAAPAPAAATGGAPARAAVAQPAGAPAAVGDQLRVSGSIAPAGDYAKAMRAHVELRVEEAAANGGRRGGMAGVVDAVRRRAQRALSSGLPPPEAGLLRGMVLGDDSGLPDGVRDDMRASGLTHIVAASGANVALLAAVALAFARALALGFRARWLLVLGLTALYVPLAGSGPSIQRAGVMGAASAAAMLAGRPASRVYTLLLAALVTLVLDPRAATDPGWQLSFAAVAGLLVLAGRWREALVARRAPGGLAEALAVTGAATLATLPLIAARFGRLSIVSLPANLLAAPLVAPIMWLGVAAAALGQVAAPLARPLVAVAGLPLAALVGIAHVSAGLPAAQLHVSTGPATALTIAALVAVERRALLARLPARRRRPAVLSATVLAAAVGAVGVAAAARAAAGTRPPPAGHLRVTLLDVGQGDATLLQDGRDSVLVDTGPPEGRVVARLRRAGVRRLDVLVVTHDEADHVGGAAAVLSHLPVRLWLDGRDGHPNPLGAQAGDAARAHHVRSITPDAGMTLRAGRIVLHVLWPHREAAIDHLGANPNERAIVMEADDGPARVLLTADAESDVTLPLHVTGPIDILKVAHHGSNDDGLPALLAQLQPRIAGIEVGAHNSFGHPTPQTLAELRVVPTVLRTDRDGTVRLDRTATGWQVRRHR